MIRIHQFVKVDCHCTRKATHFKCKYCGFMEYRSIDEMRRMVLALATCTHQDAPGVRPDEYFRGMFGGTFDCLAPDFDKPHE